MTIEVNDLLDQAVAIATERRQQALSDQAAQQIKGGIAPSEATTNLKDFSRFLTAGWIIPIRNQFGGISKTADSKYHY